MRFGTASQGFGTASQGFGTVSSGGIVASGSGGNYYLAYNSGGAFFWIEGGNLTEWLSTNRLWNKKYKLKITDGTYYAEGYIGGTGAGLTLGSELITNGDFTNWIGDNPNNWTVSTEDGDQYVTENPSGQCQIISTAGDYISISQNILSIGKLYKMMYSIKAQSSGYIRITDVATDDNIYVSSDGVVGDGKSIYKTGMSSGFMIKRRIGVTNITIDDLSVKQVIDGPANESIYIYSTKTGSMREWASMDGSLNVNAITSWEIRPALI